MECQLIITSIFPYRKIEGDMEEVGTWIAENGKNYACLIEAIRWCHKLQWGKFHSNKQQSCAHEIWGLLNEIHSGRQTFDMASIQKIIDLLESFPISRLSSEQKEHVKSVMESLLKIKF